MEWFMKVLRQYADFEGRARRKEFWMFTLFYTVFSMAAALLDGQMGTEYGDEPFNGGFLSSAFSLALFIPSLAVSVRRLHDISKSGWYLLLWLLPIIGWIWLIVLYCQDSAHGENEYGPNPKGYGNNDHDAIDSLTV